MSNLSSTYLKRSAGPGNDGMLVDLKMGKKRILELGNAIEATDAPNKKQLDYIANVVIPFRSANMTSNTTPPPFIASAPIESASAWKAFSVSEFYRASTTSQDISLTLDFGDTKRINFVELELSTQVDEISLYDQNDTLIDSKSLTGGIIFWKFDAISTYSLKIVIVQADELVRVSKTVIGLRSVDFESSIFVQTSGLNVSEAVNIAYLNDALDPITSSIVPVYANPKMTSDITPFPYTVESTVTPLDTYEPYKAFDFDFGTNFKAVAPSLSPVRITLNVSTSAPVGIAAFELAGPSDNFDITTNNFVLTGIKTDLTGETLFTSNTPVPQGSEIYQVQTESVFISFELDMFPIRAGNVVGLNMLNIFTKAISVNGRRIVSIGYPIDAQDAANKEFVDNSLADKLSLTGGSMTGNIDMGGAKIKNIAISTTTEKGDVMSRQSILTSDLPSPLLGSVLAMSQGAILATITGADIVGTADVVPVIFGNEDLIPNPTTGDYFAFNGTNSIDIVAGSYEVALQLGFVDTSEPFGQIFVSVQDAITGQDLAVKNVTSQSSLLVKESLYFELQTQTSVNLKVRHSGAFTRLVAGLMGIYRPTIQSRKLVIAAGLETVHPISSVMTAIPIEQLNNIVPLEVIVNTIGVVNNTVSISRHTGLIEISIMADVTNAQTTPQTIRFEINFVNNGVSTTKTFGPYYTESRQGTVNAVRPITVQCLLICTGDPCSLTFGASSSSPTGVSLSQFIAFVKSV